MRQGRYLNIILTVNAILLAALIWVQITDRPAMVETAVAQSTPRHEGIPNAADQRLRMIEALRDINRRLDRVERRLETGEIRVRVMNPEDIRPATE